MTIFHRGDVVSIKDLADHPDKKDVDVEYRVKSVRKNRIRVHPMSGYSAYLRDIIYTEPPGNLILIRRKK